MAYQFSRIPVNVPTVRTKHREIKTTIPAPGTESILLQLEKHESRSMQGQIPIIWDHAKDFNVFDRHGNKWIDFTSTIFVANVGHANGRVLAAIQNVLKQNLLHSYAYMTQLRVNYIKQLVEFTNGHFQKTFLLSTGTEATEAALKLMRMYGQKKGKRRLGIICIEGNWHGRTMGAQMMSGNTAQKEWIGFHDPDIHHIPFPYPWLSASAQGCDFLSEGLKTLEKKGIDIRKDVCGVMLETFQGWGAVFYPKDFVQSIEVVCRANNILMAFDEMQAGFARTGKRFGYEHYEVIPDLICCGKGMGSGVPLSGVLGSSEVMDLPEVGNMSSTHSANPMACAAGIATIDEIMSKGLVGEAERKGEMLHSRLDNLKERFIHIISAVLGKGMIAAILFRNPVDNKADMELPSKVVERCMQKGLLMVHTGRESIKIGPPLTISDEALLEGLDVLEEALQEVIDKV
jgi:4-aminobutyrate aminotransferase / (S)-3-amino-2-methylpropionate transaminase / 5-aminovalerate transaminase